MVDSSQPHKHQMDPQPKWLGATERRRQRRQQGLLSSAKASNPARGSLAMGARTQRKTGGERAFALGETRLWSAVSADPAEGSLCAGVVLLFSGKPRRPNHGWAGENRCLIEDLKAWFQSVCSCDAVVLEAAADRENPVVSVRKESDARSQRAQTRSPAGQGDLGATERASLWHL